MKSIIIYKKLFGGNITNTVLLKKLQANRTQVESNEVIYVKDSVRAIRKVIKHTTADCFLLANGEFSNSVKKRANLYKMSTDLQLKYLPCTVKAFISALCIKPPVSEIYIEAQNYTEPVAVMLKPYYNMALLDKNTPNCEEITQRLYFNHAVTAQKSRHAVSGVIKIFEKNGDLHIGTGSKGFYAVDKLAAAASGGILPLWGERASVALCALLGIEPNGISISFDGTQSDGILMLDINSL